MRWGGKTIPVNKFTGENIQCVLFRCWVASKASQQKKTQQVWNEDKHLLFSVLQREETQKKLLLSNQDIAKSLNEVLSDNVHEIDQNRVTKLRGYKGKR